MKYHRLLTIAYLGFWGGAIGVLGKWAFASFTPMQLIFIRIFVSLLILGAVLIYKKQFSSSLCKIFQNIWHFATLAFWGIGGAMALGFIGLGATSAIAYDLLFNLSGLLMVAVAWYRYKEKVTGRELFLLFLALMGATLIIFRSEGSDTNHSIFGDMLVLIAALGWAIYSVVGGKAIKNNPEFDPLSNLFGSFIVASIPFAIYIAYADPFNSKIDSNALAAALTLSIFGTAILFLLWFKFVEHSSGAVSAMVALSENVGGVIFPIIFLNESLTLRTALGGGIIITALVIAELRPASKGDEK